LLDADTKRRIDTCRDILVGKVPDPKSQVEQITISLIYKFMDDMDSEAEELGGKRSFFVGEYAKYGWSKLMAPNMGGFDVLALYSEAIQKMNENPGIPALFRDIFKNAYLPYRDPETLRIFLKEINEFTYDHSERLGDAFEYLLSVLGSQGDAGQFRTPRHIIDFMIEVIDPQKNESILDPACGTAGFLISAWKHILKQNTKERAGDMLSPDERQHIAANISGYDISPDMVRLSLVNLYLHGFSDPHIVEYDTLTSDEKWNETADVILANPPFMSPKGGIKPHKRFSVQATRSEVLFVDYMAEHLSPQGRAAIVVPEGIIFQSGTAYKQLRAMLVKTALVAVVSLPAGVFNPYSGVKTSILILDKRLAKQTSEVLFVKIENDGYNLGAQRRAVTGSGLPEAVATLREFFTNPVAFENSAMAHKVTREKIGENGDWNLSGDRYQVENTSNSTAFPLVSLEELCTFMTGGTPTSTLREYYENGSIPWLVSGDIHQKQIVECVNKITELGLANSNAKILPFNSVLIALNGQGKTRGAVALLQMKNATCNQSLVSIYPDQLRLMSGYLFNVLDSMYQSIRNLTGDNQRSGLNIPIIKTIQIPLPPLSVQQEIVAEIEGYQKIIDGARQVVENYKPYIAIDPEWPIMELSEICSFKNGLNFDKTSSGHTVKIIGVSDFKANLYAPLDDLDEVHLDEQLPDSYLVKEGDILFVRSNGNPNLVGRSLFVSQPTELTTFSGFTIRGRIHDERAMPLFFAYFFKSRDFSEMIKTVGQGASIRNLSQGILNVLAIPLPSLETQRAIVAEIEAEQALVNANKQLIARFEAKIKTTINRVWGAD
jgi:type I restriction enzyme M protein